MARRRNPQSVKQFAPGSTEGNPLVFMDIAIEGERTKRIHIELMYDVVPRTCENFRQLCTGETSMSYRENIFHRIIPEFMMQAGDTTYENGIGGKAVVRNAVRDENFILKHGLGSVSVAHQNNTNRSQFFITFLDQASWLDGKHVVFGQVVKEDLDFLKTVETLGTESGRPLKRVLIKNCGQICGAGMTRTLDEDTYY